MIAAGVIGWPVAQSKSPLIHRFWLTKLGIDGDYGRFAVHSDHLGDAIRALPTLGLRGVNVTAPHKIAVMAFLDRVDPVATRVGAVNTVVVEGDTLAGYNTDVEGFEQPLWTATDNLPSRRIATSFTVIGTGGAARAVLVALAEAKITLYGRDPIKTRRLVEELVLGSEYGSTGSIDNLATPFAFKQGSAYATGSKGNSPDQTYGHAIINATTLGMTGQPPLAIDLGNFPDDTLVYDLVYAPLDTPLLVAARARGLRTIDGLQMLVGQAATAFELFFGAPAPRQHDAELRALLIA